nr:T9SS type A sorting domain-containing protein [Saprospiraceae bacterium]
ALESDLTVEGNLHLETGNVIDISDVALTLNGDLTGDGSFDANTGSSLAIHTEGGTTSGLNFEAANQVIGDFSIDVGAGNSVDLNSDLSVEGTLNLESGSILDITDQTLNINGDLTGEGALNANAGSSLAVNAAGGTTAGLNFATDGQVLGDLSIDADAGNEVGLNSDLTVEGVVDLQSGVLALNESELVINGDLTGSGSFSADAGSDLTLNVDGGTTAGLNFEAGGQTIGDLTINIGDGNSIALESDLTVEGNLHLETGNVIDISDVELILNGDFTGEGLFFANSETCLVVSTTQSVTAGLPFVTGGNTVGKLIIDIDGGGSANLENHLFVTTELTLENGELVLNGFNLDVSGDLSATGSVSIHSTADSDISLDLNTSASGELRFSAEGNTTNDLTLNIDDGGSLELGSELNIASELALSGSGNISLGDSDLIIEGGANISGSGSGSYVITAGDGSLVMSVEAGAGAQFPVGTQVNFSPAVIELNQGSTSGQVMVNVATGVQSEGNSGIDIAAEQSVVNATWFIDSDIDANLDMNIEVWWSTDMEVNNFNNSEVYLSHYTEGNWDMTATAEANQEANGMWSIQREGITSLSPFAVFDESTVVFVRDFASIELEIYPNPTAGKISVNGLDESIRDFEVTIYNATGQLMESHRFSNLNFALNLDHFQEGNYFIRIHNDEVDLVRQVVKIKP